MNTQTYRPLPTWGALAWASIVYWCFKNNFLSSIPFFKPLKSSLKFRSRLKFVVKKAGFVSCHFPIKHVYTCMFEVSPPFYTWQCGFCNKQLHDTKSAILDCKTEKTGLQVKSTHGAKVSIVVRSCTGLSLLASSYD